MAAGNANFDDLLALILRNCDIQQWDRVLELLDQAVNAGGNKLGMEWVRDALLSHSRRREELRQRILERAATLATTQPADKADSQDLFLADHVLGQAAGILEANEMLALLDTLKPIYVRQPEHVLAAKRWTQQRINYLQQTGQADESLHLQEELAKAYPHDCNVQQQYAQALFDRGDTDDAYAWLDRVITPEAKWLPNEEETLRNAYAQLLRGQGRYPDLVEYLRQWVEKNPEVGSLYGQYLNAMVRADQLERANELVVGWMREGRKPEKLPMDAYYRLQAAVSLALGQGYDMHTNRLEEQWLDELAQTALSLARHESEQLPRQHCESDHAALAVPAYRHVP